METIKTIVETGYKFNNRFIKILNGVISSCKKQHYKFQPVELGELQDTPASLRPILVVGASTTWSKTTAAYLYENGFLPIIIGFEFDDNFSSFVTQNHFRDAYTLTHMPCSEKQRRCAYIGFNAHSFGDLLKIKGLKKALKDTGHDIGDEDIFPFNGSAIDVISSLLANIKKYDTVFCANDTFAFLLTSVLREKNHFDIVSFGDLYLKHYSAIPFYSISPDYYNMGKLAVELYSLYSQYQTLSKSTFYVTSKFDFISTTDAGFNFQSNTMYALTQNSEKNIDLLNIAIEKCDEIDLKMLDFIMKNYTYEDIAAELYLSTTSIKKRLRKIFCTLGITSKSELSALLKAHKLNFEI